MEYFHNKKILITQNALHFLAGSEITTLELATFFQQNGADVLVFTWCSGPPMINEFKKRGIPVTADEEDDRFNDIDIVWVHHQTIPEKILATLKTEKHPQFFFFHMSPLDCIPIERPYLNNIESEIASKILFSSEGTKDSLLNLFPSLAKKSAILENLLPNDFCTSKYNTPTSQTPRNVLIVSNHPPREVIEATTILSKHHIKVNHVGQNGKTKLITASMLKKNDLVITIGKTVVYCLGMGIPVYVYDHFGGPGFLSEKNIDKARYRTFSGRGFDKKTPQEIADEIITGYQKNNQYQTKHTGYFRDEFSTQNQLTRIFQNTSSTQVPPISIEYYNTLKTILQITKSKVISENNLLDISKSNKEISEKLHTLYEEYQKLSADHTNLTKEYHNLSEEHKKIINSKKFRFLTKVSQVFHFIKH